MKLLVVGAGEIGRWVADTVPAEVSFTDLDETTAADAAAGRDARVVPADTTEQFEAVCLAVPMSAVPDAVAEYAENAQRGMFDVSGQMQSAIEAMQRHVDGERASFHPLFAPPRVPGTVAVTVDEGGPVVDQVFEGIRNAGNEVFHTSATEHDQAMKTVQAGAHTAILSWALAADRVPDAFHTPVSEQLQELVETVTEGSAGVYGEIQAEFEGAGDVADVARRIAETDREEFETLYREASENTSQRDRHE